MTYPTDARRLVGFTLIAALGLAALASAQTREENAKRCGGFNQNPDLAIGACTALIQSGLQTNEGLLVAFVSRGNAYGLKGDYDRALRDYAAAIQLNPAEAWVYNARGVTYWDMGDLDRALRDQTKVITLDPRYVAAFVSRAYVLLSQGEYTKAMADLNEARRLGLAGAQPPLEPAEHTIRMAVEDGLRCSDTAADADLRIGACTALIRDHSKMPNAVLARVYNQRGVVLSARREFQRTYDDYSEAIRLNPSEPVYFSNRGIAATWLERYDEAKASFAQSLKLNPQSAAAVNGQGLVARQQGDYTLAVQKFTDALRITPASAQFATNRGIAYLLMGQNDRSLADLNASLAINPKDAHALFARGVIKRRQGNVAGGDADIAAATELQADIVVEMRRRHVERHQLQ